jgi:hypothetical protein
MRLVFLLKNLFRGALVLFQHLVDSCSTYFKYKNSEATPKSTLSLGPLKK